MKPMPRILKYTFSLLLFLPFYGVRAQSISPKADTVLSNGVRIGFDLSRLSYYYLTNQKFRSFEVSGDVGYKKMLFVVEAGNATIKKEDSLFNYRSNGYFARIGIERNLLKGGDDVVFYGARYAMATFNFESDFRIPGGVWSDYQGIIDRQSFTAHWAELVGGLKVLVWRNIYFGFTTRIKVKVGFKGNENLGAITIPGFGNSSKNNAVGFNYYIFYRIPFKK